MTSPNCDGRTRRDTVRVGVLSALGLTLADALRLAEATEQSRGSKRVVPGPARPPAAPRADAHGPKPVAPAADAVIFIHLNGGPAHLDTLDMKPDAPADERSPFALIPSKLQGLPVCEHLPKLAHVLDRFTLLRGMSHSAGAHPQANEWLYTGNRPSPAVRYPALGSVAVHERPGAADVPGFVAVPTTEMQPGYLGVAYAPFKTNAVPRPGQKFGVRGLVLPNGVSADRIRQRDRLLRDLDTRLRAADAGNPLLEGLDRFGQQAQAMLLSPRAQAAFDVEKEAPSVAQQFGADPFGQSLLLASRLVEHGVRFVTVNSGGWDTHLDNFSGLKDKLLPPFDAGIAALVQVLADKGLLARTLVVAGGEFGRTPSVNKNAGRDHWPRAGWMLLAGGGVRAGQLIGGTDRKGHGPDDSTSITPDDIAASVFHALGIDPRREFATASGRPVTLVPEGKVIAGLFG